LQSEIFATAEIWGFKWMHDTNVGVRRQIQTWACGGKVPAPKLPRTPGNSNSSCFMKLGCSEDGYRSDPLLSPPSYMSVPTLLFFKRVRTLILFLLERSYLRKIGVGMHIFPFWGMLDNDFYF